MRDPKYPGVFWKTWGAALTAKRPEITIADGRHVGDQDARDRSRLRLHVTRDFVRSCHMPILVLPDDSPAHPYAVAIESAMLLPNAEVSLFPWKEPKDRIPLAVRHIHSFLKAHRPA